MEMYNRLASRYDAFVTMRRCYDELEDHEDESGEEHEKLRHWAAGMMEENERLRAETGDAEGLVRALRRRERRRADRLENGNAREPKEAGS